MAFVTITVTPSPITPMIKGIFPEKTFRGKVCLLQHLQDEEIYKKDFLSRCFIVIQIFYATRFLFRMNRYINGRCPGGKMCSIGKYRRNIVGLNPTFWFGVSGSCFLLLQNIVRIITHGLSRWQAFYANFILLDSLIYLFYISIFCLACIEDIPSVSETSKTIVFYVSRPTVLEPRRPKRFQNPSPDPVPGTSTQIVRPGGFELLRLQRTAFPSMGTVQRSPKACHQQNKNKNPNIKIPKLTHVKAHASAEMQLPSTSKQHRFIYLTKK